MRCVVYSAWCVFSSCFIQGAWRCLNQDMDLKARHVFFSRLDAAGQGKNMARRKRSYAEDEKKHIAVSSYIWRTTGSYGSAKINNYASEHPEAMKTLYAMGWYDANSAALTHPVGKKQPNPWGFYDMHGNVWEWCSDRHGAYPSGIVTDPIGATSDKCIGRVLRGGSYNADAKGCRSAWRGWCRPHVRLDRYGFRLCCSLEPTE